MRKAPTRPAALTLVEEGHSHEEAGQTVLEQLAGRRRAYQEGKAGMLLRESKALSAAGGLATALGGRIRPVRVAVGAALLAAFVRTRFGVFQGGVGSAEDPAATIEPQRARAAQPA